MTTGSEVTGHRLIRNTVANGIASVVSAILALAMTPFLLRRLGEAEYGIWLLATALTFGNGYLALADLGLQQAGVRLIAHARGLGEHQRVTEVVSTLITLFAVLGVVIAAAAVLLADVLAHLFKIDPSLRTTAHLVFMLVGLQIAVDLPVAALLSLVEGSQRYALLRVVDVGSRVVWAVLVVVAVYRGAGVVALAIVSLVVAGVAGAVAFLFARTVEPDLHVTPRLASRRMLRELLGFGSSVLVLRILSVVYRQMDRAIIGIALAAATVARYEVAYKIHATAALILSVAPSAVMPAAAYVGAAGQRERLRRLYLRGTKYSVALCLPVTIAAMLYAKALIATWVGAEYTGLTGATRLFLVYPALVVVHVIGLTILIGLGRMKEMVLLNVASVGINLVVSIALVDSLGISGVIWGTLIGYLVLWVPYTRIFWRTFDVGSRAWFGSIIGPNLWGLAAQLLFGVVTIRAVENFEQLWQVVIAFSISCAVSVGVFLLLGVAPKERRELFATVHRLSPNSAEEGSAS